MGCNREWLNKQQRDIYVRRAHKEGYPSRAAYKLLELDAQHHFIQKGMTILDLGAAPGGWSVVAQQKVGQSGFVLAIDRTPIHTHLCHVHFLQACLEDPLLLDQIIRYLSEHQRNTQIDLVLSDAAPDLTGQSSVDQVRSLILARIAFQYGLKLLKSNGCLVVKVFQGHDLADFTTQCRVYFQHVKMCKPNASRPRSREIYLVARCLIPQKKRKEM